MQKIHNTTNQASRWERPAFASGALAALTYIAMLVIFMGFIAPKMPPMDASAEQAIPFLLEQSQSIVYHLYGYLSSVRIIFLVVFLGALYGALRRAEGGSSPLAAGVFAAGIGAALITPLATMIEDHVLLGLAAAGADPVVVKAMDGLVPLSFALSGFPQAVVLGGTSILLSQSRFAPRWINPFGITVAVLSLIGTGTLLFPSLFPLTMLVTLLFNLWLLALSLAMLKSSQKVGWLASLSAAAD
jgi:hypothetical protein